MATEGSIQLPPDSTGSAVRTRIVEKDVDDTGTLTYEHLQVVTVATEDGAFPRHSLDDVYFLLSRILVELQRQTLALSLLIDEDVTKERVA